MDSMKLERQESLSSEKYFTEEGPEGTEDIDES